LDTVHQKNISLTSVGSKKSKSKENKSQSDFDIIDDGRAIPGGRYGCAQFVKVCGQQNLRSQSLGRLAALVQKCIKDDHMRYQKTLLVWRECIDKSKVWKSSESSESQEELLK
jgi:hypothetical protein